MTQRDEWPRGRERDDLDRAKIEGIRNTVIEVYWLEQKYRKADTAEGTVAIIEAAGVICAWGLQNCSIEDQVQGIAAMQAAFAEIIGIGLKRSNADRAQRRRTKA